MIDSVGKELQRRWAHWKCEPGPLKDFLQTPWPSASTPLDEVELIALDMEATGLDLNKDDILSIGYVIVRNGRIHLDEHEHILVRPRGEIPEDSAVIHGILDDHSQTGVSLREAMEKILPVLSGKVLVAHHARIEKGFFRAACQNLYGGHFTMPVIDTMALEKRWMDRQNQHYQGKALRLDAIRQRYNLPRYKAHNALMDAVATAEVLMAQISRTYPNGVPKLGWLMS